MRLAIAFERVDPSRGGAETYVADLCRALVRRGHRISLYARSWCAGALPAEVECHAVEASGLTRPERIWTYASNAEAMLTERRHHYDATIGLINTWGQDVLIPQGGVHPASLEYNARRFPPGWRRWAYLAGKRTNPKMWMYRALEQRQYDPARSTHVVAVSRMVQGHLERFYGVQPERIRVIPNAIDPHRMAVPDRDATRAEFRQAQGFAPDDVVALFVAHNFALKGLGPLLEALALRRRDDPQARPVHLAVCGGGKLAAYRPTVERLGLQREVRLIGFLPEIAQAFHGSDFFVLPSYYDPCSLVVFEALACGLPVITTACNGAGEVLSAGYDGFVVPSPDDVPALAHAIESLTDDAVRRRMSVSAEATGLDQSFDRHVTRLIDFLEDVIGWPEKARFAA